MTEFHVRETVASDGPLIEKWLLQKGVLEGFPMIDEKEVKEAVRLWLSYIKLGASLTLEENGEVIGSALVYVQGYEKQRHQALFVIAIDEKHRGKGAGTYLLKELMKLGKEKFHIEFFHLEVYEGNPAIRLYERLGFKEYGRHPKFLKDGDKYLTKILMQKDL